MTYVALARKWRPRTFSQLVGQEHIKKVLTNSLTQERLHHAYLFTGTRGVGKTSIARILAKALNCEQGIRAEPCLACDNCLAIEQGRFIDLIEIDGASRTKVEDTRELLDNVQYLPTQGRFKIYLIDEVHMLSSHSFNALLKTLEEPPSHVKFFLATTEQQKLPITILSRCLQFNLKQVLPDIICQHLKTILHDEQLPYEDTALEILATAARGSIRDALSLLDQGIASCDTLLQTQDVKNILGLTQQDYALALLRALADSAPQTLMNISQQIAEEGGHFQYVTEELLRHLHQMSISQHLSNLNPLIKPSADILALSSCFSAEDIQLFYQIVLKGLEDMHLAPIMRIGFEMMLLRMYTFKPASDTIMPTLAYQTQLDKPSSSENNPNEQPLSHIATSEFNTDMRGLASDATSTINLGNSVKDTQVEKTSEMYVIPNATAPIQCSSLESPEKTSVGETPDWGTLLPHLKLSGLALNAAENAELISFSESGVILRVSKGHSSLFTTAVIKRIEQGLTNYYKKVVKLTLSSDELVLSSPAQQRKQNHKKAQENAATALQNDPFFNQLQQEFSAELVKNSIESIKDDL